MGEHTPGPWVIDGKHPMTGYADTDALIRTEAKHVASIFGGLELQPKLTQLPTFAECRANAQLIAAAPELLYHARTVAFHLRRGDYKEPRAVDQMIAALEGVIAKATTERN